MCMLSFFPAGIAPSENRITNGANANPDGHGFAMVVSHGGVKAITSFRSMNADETIDRFMSAREKDSSGPALFHSRIATSGHTDITGCHPFRVGNDPRTLVAHNGILFSPPKFSTRSDTALFAEYQLPFFNTDKPRRLVALEQEVGPGNKLVILTVNPKRRKNAYLINERMGNWVSGEWHSNHDYEDWSPKLYSYGSYVHPVGKYVPVHKRGGTGNTEPWPCDLCGSFDSVDSMTLVCGNCRTCNSCEMFVEECKCYGPITSETTVFRAADSAAPVESLGGLIPHRTQGTCFCDTCWDARQAAHKAAEKAQSPNPVTAGRLAQKVLEAGNS